MDKNLYKFGMDWLNGVLPVTDVWEVFSTLEKFSSKLRFERWELVNSGKYNYSRRFCLDGKATIQLMYNPVSEEEAFTACCAVPKDKNDKPIHKTHNNPYVFFSISGDGIRYLHSLGGDVSALNKLMFYFYNNQFKASRFDVYCDILDKKNTAVPLIQKAFKYFLYPRVGMPTLRTNVQRKSCNISMYRGVDDKGKVYHNCVLGNHGTRFGMFRCYNKRMELLEGRLCDKGFQLLKDYSNPDYLWRLEYEMHKEHASACFDSCMKQAVDNDNILSFDNVFASALERVFDIVEFNFSSRSNNGYGEIVAWTSFCNFVMEDCIDLV